MTSTVSIPARPTDITPAWLTSVLGADVREVDVAPIGTGQTGATYRLSVGYGDTDVRLPATFAVKLPAQDEAVRERVTLGYLSEHAFYQSLADRTTVPVPDCYHCEIDRDGADFVLLLADMAPAVQGDQIAGCSAEEARLAAVAIAGLHGPSWGDEDLAATPGIAMVKPDAASAQGMGDVARMAADMTIEKLGDKVSPQDRETLIAAMSVVTPWLLTEPDRFSLLHGDYRLDNLLFDPDRSRVTVVDWQTLGVGLPARDLAYFLATSLPSELRPQVERDLVEAYHRELLTHGVADYSAEDCWRDYRLGTLQAPLITVLGCAFASSTERGDDMMAVMAQRGCQAIRDLGALDLIES
jgi:hypothetical protein